MALPLLDVTDAILDPDFCQPLTIYRATETVGQNGRATVTEVLVNPAPIGVIAPTSSGDSLMRPDGSVETSTLEIHVYNFYLRGPSSGYEPDIVMFQGIRYTVAANQDFSQFGAGFTSATLAVAQPVAV